MKVFSAYGTVAAVETYAHLEGSVYNQGPFDSTLEGEIESDPILEGIVQPRDLTIQDVRMVAEVNGVPIAAQYGIGELVVEHDYDNIVQGWSFNLPLTTPAGLFGTPFSCYGPALGIASIDIYGEYRHANGVSRVKLISDGVVDNAPRESGEGGIQETYNGVDRGGRYDGVKVTKQFPPGHGLYRGRVGRELFKSVGEEQVDFEDGFQMFKEMQVVDAEPFPIFAELQETENRKVFWRNSDGYAINPQVGRPRSGESAQFSFDERDCVRVAKVRLEPQANVITLVIANGTKQNAEDPAPCLTRVEEETRLTFQSDYVVYKSLYRQREDGDYDTLTPHEPVNSYLTAKVYTKRTYRCDVLIEEFVKRWGMIRREVPRHEWDETGGEWLPLECYTDDQGGVAGGPAFYEESESLQVLDVSLTKYFYLHPEFISHGASRGEWGDVVDTPNLNYTNTLLMGSGDLPQTPFYGQAQGTVTFFSRLGHIQGKVRDRPNEHDVWEDINPDDATLIWGDGSGYQPISGPVDYRGFIFPEGAIEPTSIDALIPWSLSVTGFEGTDEQYLAQQQFAQFEWRSKRGWEFYYGENDSRYDPFEMFQRVDTEITDYTASGNTHTQTVTHTDNITGRVTTNPTNGLPGAGPSIERLDFVEPSTDIYEAGEATEIDPDTGEPIPGLDKKARRGDTETIIVEMPFDFLLACHLPNEVTVEFPWAEDKDELARMAEALVQESGAMPCFWTLSANFLLKIASLQHLTYRPLGIDHDVRLKRVVWRQAPLSPLFAECEGRLYPW